MARRITVSEVLVIAEHMEAVAEHFGITVDEDHDDEDRQAYNAERNVAPWKSEFYEHNTNAASAA